MVVGSLGVTARRALEFGGVVEGMQRAGEVEFLFDECAVACFWGCGESAERIGYSIGTIEIVIIIERQ